MGLGIKPAVGLGCVQIGLPYGNKSARSLMREEEARLILCRAAVGGVQFFDTAPSYGESESRIGRSGVLLGGDVEVSTKVSRVDPEIWSDEKRYWAFLTTSISSSCNRLGVARLGLLQLHQCDLPFLESVVVRRCLVRLLDEGYCTSLGVSVYHPDQALLAISSFPVTVLQVPVNIVDSRFISPPLLEVIGGAGIRLIARSIMLQGVLVPDADLPAVKRKADLGRLRELMVSTAGGESIHELCFRYVFSNLAGVLDTVLIGVDSMASLEQNLYVIEKARKNPLERDKVIAFGSVSAMAVESGLVDPQTWNK